ncbi:hypothetical protein RS030_71085 [Cryptosporidium xiaoi]|uniref:Poly(A) RNA polymerase mitochondrial-like central palm domain-containing protein n=1 Tax=Cryptosporidium xiaoi TaxID=659607 RepID=A0AAV9XTD9_9CRYT
MKKPSGLIHPHLCLEKKNSTESLNGNIAYANNSKIVLEEKVTSSRSSGLMQTIDSKFYGKSNCNSSVIYRKTKSEYYVSGKSCSNSSVEFTRSYEESNTSINNYKNVGVNSDVSYMKNNPRRVFEIIDKTLNALLDKIVPGQKKKKEKLILLQCVELLVNETFGDSAKLFLTGSAAADIDSETSDIDLVVFTSFESRIALMKMANKFKSIRWKHREECINCKNARNSNNNYNYYSKINLSSSSVECCIESLLCDMEVNVITTAKVPVMMMRSKQAKFKTECDISINMYTSLMHSILFQCVLFSHPELQSVLRLIKYWLHIRRLPVAKDGGLPCIAWLFLAIVHCSIGINKPYKSQKEYLENVFMPAKQVLSSLQIKSSNCYSSFQSTEMGSPINFPPSNSSPSALSEESNCECSNGHNSGANIEKGIKGNIINNYVDNEVHTEAIDKVEREITKDEMKETNESSSYVNNMLEFSIFSISGGNNKNNITSQFNANSRSCNSQSSLIQKDDVDFNEKGTTFMALVSFFKSIWNRNSLTCSVSVINKNIQPKDLKTTSQVIFSNGGIWDEILTLDDPSASLLRQLEVLKLSNSDDFEIGNKLFKHIFSNHSSEKVSGTSANLDEVKGIGEPELDTKNDITSLLVNHNSEWRLPPSDCMIVSNLAARITCGTWLVYLYELKRGHDILDTYLQQISMNNFNESEIVSKLFKPINDEIYKIPAKLSTKTPLCVYPCVDLDLIIEKDIIALVQVPYYEQNHKFCLILLFGHLVILRIEKICVDWEGGWWSKEFLNRRDVRSVLHGTLFLPIPLSLNHLDKNGSSAFCILQPLDSRIINYIPEINSNGGDNVSIDEVMVNPALFITLINNVEWYSVDDLNGFYIIPINEYYRFLDIESIAKESPYWYENFSDNNHLLQPLLSMCRFCKRTSLTSGMEKVLKFKSTYWTIKRRKDFVPNKNN